MAARIANGIHAAIPPVAAAFLAEQRMAVASSVDSRGRVWASLLSGEAGFIEVLDHQTVRIEANMVEGDPLHQNLEGQAQPIGLVIIDLATRRRMRLNGKAWLQPEGSMVVQAEQVYSNCPKYIQRRQLSKASLSPGAPLQPQPKSESGPGLSREQQGWLAEADTFFIATYHPQGGADASHRGGRPGFVRVLDETTLLFPDYSGNNMFQTLGNLVVQPRAGLLFIDFEGGSTLQLTGQGHLSWEGPELKKFAGAERVIRFGIEQVIETVAAHSLRGPLVEYSPFIPTP